MSINADGYGMTEAMVSAIEAIVNAVAPGSAGVSSVGGSSGAVTLRTINSTNLTDGGGNLSLQVTLASGANIKTVNGNSLLGSGDLVIAGGNVSNAGTLNQTQLIIGNDAASIRPINTVGTPQLVLHGNTLGDPFFAAVALTSEVSGILPKANGGTGTNTPSLVAGSNVSISGTWPNQTVSATGGTGGSGVTSPIVVAYDTEILLDDPIGYSMIPQYLTTDDTLTIGAGSVDGGFTTIPFISDGTHAPTVPVGTFSRGGAFASQVGRWSTLTVALVNHVYYTQWAQGPRSPVIDELFIADGAPTQLHVKFHSDLDQSDSGVEAAAYGLFTVSGGAHNPTASVWGDTDEIILTVPSFVPGLSLTGTFANDGSIVSDDLIGEALNFVAVAIDDQIVDLASFRWSTLVDMTESGTGPYTYTATSSGPCSGVGGSLKMTAGVAGEIVFTKTALDGPSPDDEFTVFLFSDSNNTVDTANPEIIGVGVGNSFFYAKRDPAGYGTPSAIVIATGSKLRLRKDTSNILYCDAMENGGSTYTNIASVAGSAIDYFIQAQYGSAGTGTQAYQVTSVSGMVAA